MKKAIDEAEFIGGMKECLCRAGGDCQTYPHDLACLFLNLGGHVVVDHGMAVELTKEEAYERVDRAAVSWATFLLTTLFNVMVLGLSAASADAAWAPVVPAAPAAAAA